MAFWGLAVRSRLSPPQNPEIHWFSGLFLLFFWCFTPKEAFLKRVSFLVPYAELYDCNLTIIWLHSQSDENYLFTDRKGLAKLFYCAFSDRFLNVQVNVLSCPHLRANNWLDGLDIDTQSLHLGSLCMMTTVGSQNMHIFNFSDSFLKLVLKIRRITRLAFLPTSQMYFSSALRSSIAYSRKVWSTKICL